MSSADRPRRPALPGYAELHCRSNFSFLTGASRPAELIERARELGYAGLALTDECSLAGVVRAHVALEEELDAERRQGKEPSPFRLLIGTGMYLIDRPQADLDDGDEPRLPRASAGEREPAVAPGDVPWGRYVFIARTLRGYRQLTRWISLARRRAAKGTYLAFKGDAEGRAAKAPMLAGVADCWALLVATDPDLPLDAAGESALHGRARWLRDWFGDRAILLVEHLLRPGDRERIARAARLAEALALPVAAAGDVLMHRRSRKPLLDVLTATRIGQPIAACGDAIAVNAEQHLRRRARVAQLHRPEWLAETVRIAEACDFRLTDIEYRYPEEIVPAGVTPLRHLRALAWRGAHERFGADVVPKYRARIEQELSIIGRLRYEAYFLTVAGIVRWAREQGILCQGRGSAANSIVCYCLRVTEVDPERGSTLLFGRFISIERNEPPDIDIDFEHERREEVIQHIYRKYGRERAALTAVVISYRPRSALRDVGRALGIDLHRIEAVSKSQHWFDGRTVDPERLRENGFDPESPLVRRWMLLTQQLMGFPRHLSQHPGGFVIAAAELAEYVPIENASMEGRSVVQWDKDDLDVLRILKVDVLGIGMLSAIRRSLAALGEVKLGLGRAMTMQDIGTDDDPATYDMICRADTVGVFQIESRAQMSMLPRLRPRRYYDLVVEVAIVRPGPIQGGMVHPYLRNRHQVQSEEPYPERLKEALERTRGVPIFQEQVMQIAMLAADFTPGEADELRRKMAAWKRRGGLGDFHHRMVGRMVENGFSQDYAERIFKQIQGFGEYGFPESHAAGFALLAYYSSWIKCHHPDVFLLGLLNAQPLGFYAPAQLVRDARQHGVEVRPVDVARSEVETVLETPHAAGARLHPVRLGLDRITGLSADEAARIVAARGEQPFASVEDLAARARLDAHALGLLARADALLSLAGHRHQAAWAVAGVDTRPTAMLRQTRTREDAVRLEAPAEAEQTLADYHALGLTLRRHPLALLREELHRTCRVEPAEVLNRYPNGRLARASGLVTHRQRPETAKGTVFVTLEDETGHVNVIVWPRVVDAQRKALLGATLLTVYGRWQCEGEGDLQVRHLVAMRLVDHTPLLGGLATRSRDFR